jgi:hypothetical protein
VPALLPLLTFIALSSQPPVSVDLRWLVPPGWSTRPCGPDLCADDPNDRNTTMLAVHTETQTPVTRAELEKSLALLETKKLSVTTAALGSCSSGVARFPCNETADLAGPTTTVTYGWLDKESRQNRAALYMFPARRRDELLLVIRRTVGWRLEQTVRGGK